MRLIGYRLRVRAVPYIVSAANRHCAERGQFGEKGDIPHINCLSLSRVSSLRLRRVLFALAGTGKESASRTLIGAKFYPNQTKDDDTLRALCNRGQVF